MIDALNEWISLIGSLIGGALRHAPGIAAALAPGILLLSVLLIAARVFIVLPLRRRERAHAFLDLLEMSLKQGRSPENMIVEVAATGDKTLGKDFRQLATQIQEGASLGRGLTQTPRFLPVPIAAMLQAGEEMRDVRKVLPPCRDALASGPSRAMGAFNYLPVFSPGLPMLAIAQFLAIVVLPKFQEIWRDLLIEKRSLPFATQLFLALARYAVPMNLLLLTVILVLFSLMFERGRRVWAAGYSRLLKPLGDRCLFRLPWRRKRMQRDFSAMLAILLDTGMPEADAVNLAAHSAGNSVFLRRAWDVVERLQQGVKLTEAIRAVDDTGEFHWRLTNAAHAGTGFLRALQGWHDALEAKAFQQEQAASQAISTAFIVLNGALVCLIALAVFQPMIAVIQEGTMW
jgi:type II secretory pathway component PulF